MPVPYRHHRLRRWAAVLAVLLPCAAVAASDFADRFKEIYASPLTVKREPVYAFTETPTVRRDGDRIDIAFAVKGYCDVTVAIEDADGRIVRHLASGVLGPNAPEPFQKGTLRQQVRWNGKNDRGVYLDDKDSLTVRVSLGLRPRFERTLYHSPYKRLGRGTICLEADREGFYVYDVNGTETIRLYGHDGAYRRTVYPFPADRIDQVKMPRRSYPDGITVPAKRAYFLATLFTGRESGGVESTMRISSEASALTCRDGWMALAGVRVNRFRTDGTTGGLDLWGPRVDFPPINYYLPKQVHAMALSPDHKVLYLTHHTWLRPMGWCPFREAWWAHCVFRMEFAKDDKPAVFVGHPTNRGSDAKHIDHPADVRVDKGGRVYVADHVNNRVQIFSPEAALLKTLKVEGPAKLRFHQKTGELYVFSWFLGRQPRAPQSRNVKPLLRVFGPYPKLDLRKTYPLPRLYGYQTKSQRNSVVGQAYRIALDTWVDPPRLMAVIGRDRYPQLFELREDGFVEIRNLLNDARKARIPLGPAGLQRQRMFVDHTRNKLWLFDGGKNTSVAVVIDPETGRCTRRELPMGASDMAISPDGTFYLRTGTMVGRYNPDTWREIPFYYGEERLTKWSYNTKGAWLKSGLRLPSVKTSPHWHHGGMDVNAHGDILVTCYNPNGTKMKLRKGKQDKMQEKAKGLETVFFAGRLGFGRELHVWDERGRVKYLDILAGSTEQTAGVGLDEHGNVYANAAASVMWHGKPYYKVVGHRFDQVGTLIKFKAGGGRFIKARGTLVPLTTPPDRPMDLNGFWLEDSEWTYPGVGRVQWGMDCQCWNSRFDLDLFARSFAPEWDRFRIAVLDTNGNLITRIGTYGNVDDGVPLTGTVPFSGSRTRSPGTAGARKRGLSPSEGSGAGADAETGTGTSPRLEASPRLRSVGGDEVALFDACYVATFTDRRLFIADGGNARILSVKLDYHATHRVPLKDVHDGS